MSQSQAGSHKSIVFTEEGLDNLETARDFIARTFGECSTSLAVQTALRRVRESIPSRDPSFLKPMKLKDAPAIQLRKRRA